MEDFRIERNDYKIMTFKGDKLHSFNDQPAEIWKDDTVVHYHEGKTHRVGGPAIIASDGSRHYYHHDKRHRVGGPSSICRDYIEYRVNDLLHRTEGPAMITRDNEEYYIHGQKLTKLEFDFVISSPINIKRVL